MKKEILRLDHISARKKTNDLLLENVNFTLFEGEINCIFTTETLSKTALIQLLSGKNLQISGQLYLNEKEIITASDYKLLSCASSYISLKPQLITNMSVAENLFYFDKTVYVHGMLNEKLLYQKTFQLMQDFNVTDISITSLAENLSTAQKHIVEILRTVVKKQQYLIIEDFTSSYTSIENQKLIDVLSHLLSKGISVILFSEKNHGPIELADRLTILQNKTIVFIHDKPQSIISLQIPYELPLHTKICRESPGNNSDVFFSANFYTDYIYKENYAPLSIALNNHKITGILDLYWSYCPEIINIFNGKSNFKGRLLIKEQLYILKNNTAIIDESLPKNNLFYDMNIWDNIGLLITSNVLAPFGILNYRLTKYYIQDILNILQMEYLIKEFSHLNHMPHVSYNVQMDITIAKWVCHKPKLLVFVNPYPENDNLNTLIRFREIIASIQNMGIFCLILSRNKKHLENICDTIIEL